MSHNGDMLTKHELAARLRAVNVGEVASLADVSEKTVYRLRNMTANPTYETAARLIAACDAIASRTKTRRKPAGTKGAPAVKAKA